MGWHTLVLLYWGRVMFQGVHPVYYHESRNYAPYSACKTPANVLLRIKLIHTKVYVHFPIVTTIAYIELKPFPYIPCAETVASQMTSLSSSPPPYSCWSLSSSVYMHQWYPSLHFKRWDDSYPWWCLLVISVTDIRLEADNQQVTSQCVYADKNQYTLWACPFVLWRNELN